VCSPYCYGGCHPSTCQLLFSCFSICLNHSLL
jgi:hypothetical protein